MVDPAPAGGTWRRDKNGALTQLEAPSKPQALGAYARHPSKTKAPQQHSGAKQRQSETHSVQETGGDENA